MGKRQDFFPIFFLKTGLFMVLIGRRNRNLSKVGTGNRNRNLPKVGTGTVKNSYGSDHFDVKSTGTL
jgi:hypothetical protein